MARIRTIKPEFFTSLTIADLTPEQRLTFIGLWTHVDDEGRCVDDARLIKAAVWPLDDRTAADVETDLRALSESSLITRYIVKQRPFMAVTNWAEHQKINRPTPSKHPAPEQGEPRPTDSLSTHGGLSEGSNGAAGPSREGSHPAPAGPDPTRPAAPTPPPAPNSPNTTPDDTLTSTNTQNTGHSLSTHGGLSEDSRPERNREQGTGNRETTSSEIAPRPSDPASNRPDVERICTHLADRIEANGSKRPRITKTWRTAARLLLDKDGRTEGQVIAAIDWCQNHEFWRANVLSMPKLREKYDQLRLQATRQPGGNVVPLDRAARPSTTDQRVAEGMALTARLRAQEAAQ